MALVGCEAKPAGSFIVVLRNTATTGIRQSEVELRSDVTLIGSEAVPAAGFTVVSWNAATIPVHHAEVGL